MHSINKKVHQLNIFLDIMGKLSLDGKKFAFDGLIFLLYDL